MDEEIGKKQTDGFAEWGRVAHRACQSRGRLRLLQSLLCRWGGAPEGVSGTFSIKDRSWRTRSQ